MNIQGKKIFNIQWEKYSIFRGQIFNIQGTNFQYSVGQIFNIQGDKYSIFNIQWDGTNIIFSGTNIQYSVGQIFRGTNGEEETTSPEGSPGPPSICTHHQQVGYDDINDDDNDGDDGTDLGGIKGNEHGGCPLKNSPRTLNQTVSAPLDIPIMIRR